MLVSFKLLLWKVFFPFKLYFNYSFYVFVEYFMMELYN